MEQVHSAGDLIIQAGQGLRLLSFPSGLIGGAADLDGALVARFELLSNLMEGQELPPAGLDGAGARDAVAFASGLHSSLDYLHAHICVVHVHTCAQVLVGAFAQEVLHKLVGVFEVVSAAPPLPGLSVLQVRGLVTRAALHASCAASFGHRVG